jgi:large subunit ribosomal protein L2
MIIKHHKPYTSSKRTQLSLNYSILTKKHAEKSLTFFLHSSQGRACNGQITLRHKGGGHRQLYRQINFSYNYLDLVAQILSIEYDPYRTAYIALTYYENHTICYILHIENIQIGNYIIALRDEPISFNFLFFCGNALALRYLPIGTRINNLELFPFKGSQNIRSAGCYGKIVANQGLQVAIKLPSSQIRLFCDKCLATIGRISNKFFFLVQLGKAGRARWLNIRPTVRGCAMNPIDHPHGGGTGKAPIGRISPLTPWNKKALGYRTSKFKKANNLITIHDESELQFL